MKTKTSTHNPLRRTRALTWLAGLAMFASIVTSAHAAPASLDATTLTDFDFSTAQQTRTEDMIASGNLELTRVLTGPNSGYRHMGWPVATRLPDGRTVVLIRNLTNHSGYKSAASNARRIIYSDDNMVTWKPDDVLTATPVLGVNPAGYPGNYDYLGMQAISWAYPTTAPTSPRLVVVTARYDNTDSSYTYLPVTQEPKHVYRVYLSDDRGVTWREQTSALAGLPYADAVHCGPNLVRHPEFGLVIPFGQPSNTNKSNVIARSANAGETWEVRKWTNTANSRSIEPALVTWGPGHMAMIGRERMDAYGYDDASGKYFYTQHVYRHTAGAPFSNVSFTTARTNIGGNGKTPIAKGKSGYESHDTAEIFYNPVTGRIEMLQSSRWGAGAENPLPANPENPSAPVNSLNLWSIDPVDLLDGGSNWRFDGNIVERQGIILGAVGLTKDNKDGYHPGSSIVDEAAGKQHIFVYVGVYTSYANAYRISRPLDTYAFRVAAGLPALPGPTITSISAVDSSSNITIAGTNFDKALKEVLVGSATAQIVTSSATEIKITLPVAAITGDKITVRTDNGIVKSAAGVTLPAPAITTITYDAIWPGKSVTINGTNLGGVTKVFFGAVQATVTTKTAAQIVVTVPAGVTAGNITLEYADGTITSPQSYTPATKPHTLIQPVTQQPAVAGIAVDITASAQGTPAPTYKWQYRQSSSGTWADIAASADYTGIQTAYLSINNTADKNNWQYRYVATNGTEDEYSEALTLKVLANVLPSPSGIVAASGTANPVLYVADSQNHIIQKITQSDMKAVVFAGRYNNAGTANGNGTAAQFNQPHGLSINTAGALVVADTGNSLIREITAAGAVTTTGTAVNKPKGLAAHDLNGNSYIADTDNHLIKKLTAAGALTVIAGSGVSGTANGNGTAAQFNKPAGIAVDAAGNLYVADTGNHVIRLIDTGGNVTTFAGQMGSSGDTDGDKTTAAKFKSPEDVAVDANGDVYVADTGNALIREITATTVTTIAGQVVGFKDGAGQDAWFSSPSAIALGEDGDLYVADTGNSAIRRITPANQVTTLAITGTTQNQPPPTPGYDDDECGGLGGGAASLWFFAAIGALLALRARRR